MLKLQAYAGIGFHLYVPYIDKNTGICQQQYKQSSSYHPSQYSYQQKSHYHKSSSPHHPPTLQSVKHYQNQVNKPQIYAYQFESHDMLLSALLASLTSRWHKVKALVVMPLLLDPILVAVLGGKIV